MMESDPINNLKRKLFKFTVRFIYVPNIKRFNSIIRKAKQK